MTILMALQKHYNIPVFLPEKACPFRCVYCNQKTITGVNQLPCQEVVKTKIEECLSTIDTQSASVEIAFFGGNFTGIPHDEQLAYLAVAAPYITSGKVKGIRISTRPDFITPENLKILKEHGVKAIELGVQSLDDDVLKASGRGYDAKCVKTAAEEILSHGFVLGMQMMTGLPGDNHDKALQTAHDIIAFGATETRIYPLIVLKDTMLEELYKKGIYTPQTLEEAVFTCSALIKIFIEAQVKVLKIGLHPGKELTESAAITAGPYHASFAELVYASFWAEKINLLGSDTRKSLEITVNPKDYNHIIGFKACNKSALLKLYKSVLIKTDDSVVRFTWRISCFAN